MRTPPVNPDVNDIADRAKYWHARSAEMSPNPLSDIAYPNLHEITAGAKPCAHQRHPGTNCRAGPAR